MYVRSILIAIGKTTSEIYEVAVAVAATKGRNLQYCPYPDVD